MPNRRRRPNIQRIGEIRVPAVRSWTLRNGLQAHSIPAGTQPGVRIEVIFFAGRPYEHKHLVSRVAADMLSEGCHGYEGSALSDHFDYYGASISMPVSLDTTNVAISSLNRHLPHVLPVFADMIAHPSFEEGEFRRFCKQHQQLLREDLSQVDVVAYREITSCIFGSQHPYGYNSRPEDYDTLTTLDLRLHHQRLIHAHNGIVIISGEVNNAVEEMVDRFLGNIPIGEAAKPMDFPLVPNKVEKLQINMPEAPQTSIRIGRQLFNRNHSDAAGFYVLDTLFGGYFGSRLMTNIREDKGFTYNIESSFDPMRFDGCWYIECEVAHEAAEETLTEIYREMDELCSRPVPASELRMLKGYLLGNYLTMVDGPFATAELLRSVLSDGLDMTSFDELVRVTREISAADLMQLAQRYLNPNDCWEVVVAP